MMCQLRYARWCCEAGVRAQLRIVVAPAGAWRNVAIWQRLLLRGLGRRDMGQQNKARTRWRFFRFESMIRYLKPALCQTFA